MVFYSGRELTTGTSAEAAFRKGRSKLRRKRRFVFCLFARALSPDLDDISISTCSQPRGTNNAVRRVSEDRGVEAGERRTDGAGKIAEAVPTIACAHTRGGDRLRVILSTKMLGISLFHRLILRFCDGILSLRRPSPQEQTLTDPPSPRLAMLAGFGFLFIAPLAQGAVIPAGTELEVRLSGAVGSHVSHLGDEISARVMAPFTSQGSPITFQAAAVTGVVEDVGSLRFGLKRGFAMLKLHFTSMRLLNGNRVAIDARTYAVETARERVDGEGTIEGIDAGANLSAGASFLISTALVRSELFLPAIAVKLLAVRSPDSEIYFPAGTDLVIRLANDVEIDPSAAGLSALPLSAADAQHAGTLLARLPAQQAIVRGKYSADLVNVLLLGSGDEIRSAFQAAGWTGDSRHSVLALYRIYNCLVRRMGYSTAPMSHLTLNGQRATLAYQRSLDTFARRHHIRLWDQKPDQKPGSETLNPISKSARSGSDTLIPEKTASDAWFGAASEDIGFTVRRMHLTHAIDPEIDNERAKIVNDLWSTGCVQSASLLPRDSLHFAGEKGFQIATDGDIAVLRLNACEHPQMPAKSKSLLSESSRSRQALRAVIADIARANPATVACVIFRTLATLKHRPPVSAATLQVAAWRRASFIDPPGDKPRREIVAGFIPGQSYGRAAASSFLSRKAANH